MTSVLKTPGQIHNAVPLLDCTVAPTEAELLRIGATLVQFEQHQDWGIGRTHRHHELHSNEVMIHRVDRRTDVCEPVKFSSLIELHPHSWQYTSARHLSPYEYDTRSRPEMPQEFISELWEQLDVMKVSWSVSLIPIEPYQGRDEQWIETTDPETRSMTSILVSETHDVPVSETVGWRFFRSDEGAVELAVVRQCKRDTVTGFHQAIYPSK